MGTVTASLPAEILKVNTPHPVIDKFNHTDEKTKLREEHAMANSLEIAQALKELHNNNPIDLIYERYSLFSDCGLQASKTLNVPIMLEVNSPLIEEQQRYRNIVHIEQAKRIEYALFSQVDRIATVSDEVSNYVLTKGASRQQILVMPNAVDIEHFHPRVSANKQFQSENVLTIGFVGSLKAWHGIEYLMKAFQTLLSTRDNCRLLIVGDGPLRSWLEGFISGAGLEPNVCLTGWVDYDALPGIMKNMDIAVAPYPELDDFYFSPLKIFEYLAMGLPTVASSSGQIQDIIQSNENGVLVSPGDSEGLVKALSGLIDAPELRAAIGLKAREYATHRSWRNNAKQLISSMNCDTTLSAVNF